MSAKSYSSSERGGGDGETGRMRAAILNQVGTWWGQAEWVDEERAERLWDKVTEAPEKFISPNPNASHREEASRIYEELKDEYGLKTKGDLDRVNRDYRERAERYVERKKRQGESETPAPAERDTDTDPERPESPGNESHQGAESDQSGGLEAEESGAEPEPEPERPGAESAGGTSTPVLLGQVVAYGLRECLGASSRYLRAFVAWLLPVVARAIKTGAYLCGRAAGVSFRAAVWVSWVSVGVMVAFCVGFATALVGGVDESTL